MRVSAKSIYETGRVGDGGALTDRGRQDPFNSGHDVASRWLLSFTAEADDLARPNKASQAWFMVAIDANSWASVCRRNMAHARIKSDDDMRLCQGVCHLRNGQKWRDEATDLLGDGLG